MRFDEVELQAVPLEIEEPASLPSERRTPRFRQVLALLTDLSLFAALSLALFPLMPQPWGWREMTALGGFLLMLSYYYFVGAWMLWGKTIGGAIFDVRVDARTLRAASLRWALIVAGVAVTAIIVAAGLLR